MSSDIDPELALREFQKLDFATADQLLSFCEENGVSLSYAAEARERALLASRGVAGSAIVSYLQRALDVMRASATAPVEAPRSSMGGLIGGEAAKLRELEDLGAGVNGSLLALATRNAVAVLETNATMAVSYTHLNTAVLAHMAQYLYVMKDGEVVEQGPSEQVVARPQHPYTRQLIASVPKLRGAR